MNKPIYLLDLDDNLFQTKRKLNVQNNSENRVAAIDRQQKPISFFTPVQSNFLDWLQSSAVVIPVTARGTEETSRVDICFSSWKIMTHGAVITKPCGDIDEVWKNIIIQNLSSYQDILVEKQRILTEAFDAANVKAWARINYEYDELAIYLVTKHTDSTRIEEMYKIADHVDAIHGTDGFYIHRNGNNIAWIPNYIKKGLAVKYLLDRLKTKEKEIPVIGFGDSISDYNFLKYCDWLGMPQSGQITDLLEQKINRDESFQ
jgi:hypothetical protein